MRQQLAAARGDTPEARRAFADVTRHSDELLEYESFRSFLRTHRPTEKMTAESILRAAAIAKGEKVVEMPMSAQASAILAAARKARRQEEK